MKKEKKWFVECKCYNSRIETKTCSFTGRNYSDISNGYNKFLFTGTFEEFDKWEDTFFDNDNFKVIDSGEYVEKKQRELVFTPKEPRVISKEEQEFFDKRHLEAKERELKLGIKPVYYRPLRPKAKFK